MRDALHFAKIAARNAGRHWRRSLSATLSIAAGFAAINLFIGYIADAQHNFVEAYEKRLMYGHVLIHRNDAFTPNQGMWDDGTHNLSPEQQTHVERILNETQMVAQSVRFLNISGMVTNGRSNVAFVGYGYDVEPGREMRAPAWVWNTLAGKPLRESPDGAVLGQGMGSLLGCNSRVKIAGMTALGGYPAVERPFDCLSPDLQLTVSSSQGQMNAVRVHVDGIVDAIYREVDARFLAVPLEKAQTLLDTHNVTFYSVGLKDPSREHDFIQTLDQRFKKENLPFKAISWRDHPYGDIYVQSMSFLGVFRDFTLAVTLAIVGLSVLSMFTRLIQERKREIGTLRSIGFKSSKISSLFLMEAGFVALLGNSIGVVITVIVAEALNSAGLLYKIGILAEKVPLRIALPPENFVLSAFVLAALACGAAWIAIHRMLRMKIPDCLAH